MDDSLDAVLSIDDDERGDLLFFHGVEGAGGEFGSRDGFWSGIHDVAGGFAQAFGTIALKEAAKVAVADDPGKLAIVLDGGHA